MSFISNQPLKGMVDEPPNVFKGYKWIKLIIDQVAYQFCYEEYDLPVLESFDLFSDEGAGELITEQVYHFVDKGNRKLIMRPEVTRSLARVVSKVIKQEARPLRWYSIPKCYRYERPQKGRLREFRQLNVDLIGDNSIACDLEMFEFIDSLMNSFRVPKGSYRIDYNHRGLVNFLLSKVNFNESERQQFYSLVDKKNKMNEEDFKLKINSNFLLESKRKFIFDYIKAGNSKELLSCLNKKIDLELLPKEVVDFIDLEKKIEELFPNKIAAFNPLVIRGLDYYTGLVFEVYDQSNELSRALFGGGRYDNLIGLFSSEKLSGVGFGMGIYIFSLFLQQNGIALNGKQEILKRYFISYIQADFLNHAHQVGQLLRKKNQQVELSSKPLTPKKAIVKAEKRNCTNVIFIGQNEVEKNIYIERELKQKNQKEVSFDYRVK